MCLIDSIPCRGTTCISSISVVVLKLGGIWKVGTKIWIVLSRVVMYEHSSNSDFMHIATKSIIEFIRCLSLR